MTYAAQTITDAGNLAATLSPDFIPSSNPIDIWAVDFFVMFGKTSWGKDGADYIVNILSYWFLHKNTVQQNLSSTQAGGGGSFLPESMSVPDLSINFKQPDGLNTFSLGLFSSSWGQILLTNYLQRFASANLVSCA